MMKLHVIFLILCFNFIHCSAFEKSLRARLLKVNKSSAIENYFCGAIANSLADMGNFVSFHKTNPDTDYQCLSTFGSCFTQDIPLPAVFLYLISQLIFLY